MHRSVLIGSLLVGLGLAGCSDTTLVVESNAPWEGQVDGVGSVTGTGNATFDVSGESNTCWTLRKSTLAGTLRAYVQNDNTFGLGSQVQGLQATTAPYGEVTGCVE